MVSLPKYKADRPNGGMNEETSYLGATCTPQNGYMAIVITGCTVILPIIGVMEAYHGTPTWLSNLMDILERCMDQLATKFLANRNANLKRGNESQLSQ